jgi:hypothetical protein
MLIELVDICLHAIEDLLLLWNRIALDFDPRLHLVTTLKMVFFRLLEITTHRVILKLIMPGWGRWEIPSMNRTRFKEESLINDIPDLRHSGAEAPCKEGCWPNMVLFDAHKPVLWIFSVLLLLLSLLD